MNLKKWFMNDTEDVFNDESTDQFYNLKTTEALEDGANLDNSLRNLASKTVGNIDDEIERLKKIIENTHIKVD